MFDVQRGGLSKKQSLMRLEKAKILKTAQSVKIFAGPHCKSIKYNITLSNIACMSWANIQSELFQARMLYSWTVGALHTAHIFLLLQLQDLQSEEQVDTIFVFIIKLC